MVHPLDSAIDPGIVRLRHDLRDVIHLADHGEAHLARPGGVSIAGLSDELDAIVCRDGVDAVVHGLQQMLEKS
ncbi:hypothetical protein [Brevundimonas nasdae]|uniref:Uncharacterized protein n=1 Tax=Brevundimonas nasdae TaxID=172043 RepID=A0ABX8TFW0_9CAUL|nr:hypothetical protein [Brevundimonas nasdae]QYC09814.1 hypothetical protein KWG56_14740 [Brevundimonas nasdae]QYC12603.1 hypothetical protein KWG63_10060 [Brevundimonas nasdae]